MSEENTKFTKEEFSLIAQLIESGIRQAGFAIAKTGDEYQSALQKILGMNPELPTPEAEPPKDPPSN